MARLRLVVGNTVLADSTDGAVKWMRCQKPELALKAASVEIVGGRYARNRSRAWGLAFELPVTVGRQYTSYAQAEAATLEHLCALAGGLEGYLAYSGFFGKCFGFENAALSDVRLVSEIGVSTEIEYVFLCGRPVTSPPVAPTVRQTLIKLGGKLVIIKG